MLGRLATIGAILSTSAVLATASAGGAVNMAQPDVLSVATKGDRLARPVQSRARHVAESTVSAGASQNLSVTMRDRLGRVIYASDAAAGVTSVSRNAEFAELPVQGRSTTAAREALGAKQAAPTSLGKIPVGCERAVSALTRSAAARVIGRCVT
jgi:hypothetical protein